MEHLYPPEQVSPAKRRGRGCLLGLGGIVLALLGLMLLGAWYESAAEAADARAYPPPGQMIDVGGYRLHIHCTGMGSPTVVIEAGLGDWSASWRSWTHFEYLDQAAKELGSPPAGLGIAEILVQAALRFPEMEHVSQDSASATMDFQTINVRGRASRPGDFSRADRWNRSPTFVKVARGVWRRLSQEERAVFATLWREGAALLRQPAFDAADWDRLFQYSRRAG